MWHYEYTIFNMNLDRAIQSFEVVLPGFPPILSSIDFHAPPQEPGWTNDGTFNNQGYSSAPWTFTKGFTSRLGAAKLLHKTRTPMRFGGAHCIISGLILAQHR